MIVTSDIRRIERIRKRFRASASSRLTMWRELAVLTRQYDIVTALALIEEGYSGGNRGKPHLVALAATVWRFRVENNEPLGTVVNGWVTPRERMFAAVAHNRPNFGQIIEQMYEAEALLGRLKSQWLKSLVDPIGMVLWTWAILIYFAHLVLKQFEQSPTHPKGWAITAMHAAHWILYWGSWLVPAVLVAIGLFIYWRMHAWLSRSRLPFEVYWPFSLYKALNAADFLVALSVLQFCGDDLPTSLVTMSKTAAPYLLWQISALEPLLRTKRYNDATTEVDRDFPDAMVNARLAIAQRDHPKNFPTHLKTVTDDFNAKLATQLEDNAAATRFALVIVIGLIQIAIVLLTLSTSLATY